MKDSFDEKPETRTKKSSNPELEDVKEREIIALETTQLKMPQIDSKEVHEVKGKDVWELFDKILLKTLSVIGRTCTINLTVYILMIGFGITTLVYSLIYSVFNGMNAYSTIFGILGMASFVSILLIAPQSKIRKNAANLAQFQILYRSYINQLAVLWTRGSYRHVERSMDEVERTGRLLEQVTFNTVDKIENLLVTNPNKTEDKGQTSVET